MVKQRILFFIGVWVVILPFLGFPTLWKEIFMILTGIAVMYVSYREYHERKIAELRSSDRMQPFVESKPVQNISENITIRRARKKKENLDALDRQVERMVEDEINHEIERPEVRRVVIRQEEIMTD